MLRSSPGWLRAALLVAVGALGLLAMPTGAISLDQVAWHEEARSIVVHGRLSIDESIGRAGTWAYVLNERDGRYYSKYGTLNALLSVPPLAIEFALSGDVPHESDLEMQRLTVPPLRVVVFDIEQVCLSIVGAALLWAITGYQSASRWTRILFLLMTLYCTTLWHYLRYPSSELTQAVLFLLFWHSVLRFSRCDEVLARRPRFDFWLAWFAMFLLCQTRVADLFILPIFGAYLGHLIWQSDLPWRAMLRFGLTTIVVPALLVVLCKGPFTSSSSAAPF